MNKEPLIVQYARDMINEEILEIRKKVTKEFEILTRICISTDDLIPVNKFPFRRYYEFSVDQFLFRAKRQISSVYGRDYWVFGIYNGKRYINLTPENIVNIYKAKQLRRINGTSTIY